jgi:quinol monooxygenase YgiN
MIKEEQINIIEPILKAFLEEFRKEEGVERFEIGRAIKEKGMYIFYQEYGPVAAFKNIEMK